MGFWEDLEKVALLANPVIAAPILAGKELAGGGGQKTAVAAPGKLPVDPISVARLQTQANAGQNQQVIDQLKLDQNRLRQAQAYANSYDEYALQEARGLNAGYNQALAGNTALGFANAGAANAAGQQLVSDYRGLTGGLNAMDAAALAGYQQRIAPYYTPIQAGAYNPYQSSASDIAAQQSALGNFNSMMNGGFDISAAQYASNPGDVARQVGSYNDLMGVGGGSLNYTADRYQSSFEDQSRQAAEYARLGSIANGYLDYSSQAARAYSDPASRLAQDSALQWLQTAAQGGLDQVSQAAGASASDQTINEQQRALLTLREWTQPGQHDVQSEGRTWATGERDGRSGGHEWAMGLHDAYSDAAKAYADPHTVLNQQQGLAGIKEVGDKYKSLSDPTITGQERLMMELARREQEQTERASRGAVMADLQSRGFGGSGAQLTNMLGAQEIAGQERTLADMAAQANAVARAQANQAGWLQASGMYSDAAAREREQSFSENFNRGAAADSMTNANLNRRLAGTQLVDEMTNANLNRQLTGAQMVDQMNNANANRQLTAAGMYVDAMGNLRSQEFDEAFRRAAAGDMMAVENANRRLQAMGMSADQANMMRQQSFDEAYKRGLAADAASANNQATRLQGAGMAAEQANAIRHANDLVGTFNTEQANIAKANNQRTMMQGKISAAEQSNAIRTSNDAVGMFNVGEQNRIGIANQNTRARGAEGYATQANAIRSANDLIGTFNTEQSRLQMNFATEMQAAEARRITDLAGAQHGAETDFTKGVERRAFDTTQFGLQENDRAAGRNQTAIDSEQRNLGSSYAAGRDLIGDYSGYGQNAYNRALGTTQVSNQIGGTIIGNNNDQLRNQVSLTEMGMRDEASRRAIAALSQPEEEGLLGKALSFLGL